MNVRAATGEQTLNWISTGTEASAAEVRAEISALATEHSALLFRVVYSVLRNASDAEDVVQEAFLRVLRDQKKLARIENPRVWLIRIAWNLALDRRRRLRSMPLLEEAELLLQNQASKDVPADITLRSAEETVRILRLMDGLPRKEREALRLSAIEELSISEIAAVLRTTESGVRACLFRARQRLRQKLEAEERRKR